MYIYIYVYIYTYIYIYVNISNPHTWMRHAHETTRYKLAVGSLWNKTEYHCSSLLDSLPNQKKDTTKTKKMQHVNAIICRQAARKKSDYVRMREKLSTHVLICTYSDFRCFSYALDVSNFSANGAQKNWACTYSLARPQVLVVFHSD